MLSLPIDSPCFSRFKNSAFLNLLYVIPKSFHPLLNRLDKLVRKSRLGGFWGSVWRRYGQHGLVLEPGQVEWVVKAKSEGRMTNEEIARTQNISISRVQQLYRAYRKTGTIPTLKKAGRPRAPEIT